jgi:hypothetical protein
MLMQLGARNVVNSKFALVNNSENLVDSDIARLDAVKEVFDWKLGDDDYAEVDRILRETIKSPVGPEFMAPPPREPLGVEANSNN